MMSCLFVGRKLWKSSSFVHDKPYFIFYEVCISEWALLNVYVAGIFLLRVFAPMKAVKAEMSGVEPENI
jgi:hypothetical protein